jgi:hypothetical protein
MNISTLVNLDRTPPRVALHIDGEERDMASGGVFEHVNPVNNQPQARGDRPKRIWARRRQGRSGRVSVDQERRYRRLTMRPLHKAMGLFLCSSSP